MKNWTVRVLLEVQAEDEDAATDQVAAALRAGYKGSGIAPVADFKVVEGAPKLLDQVSAAEERRAGG